MLDHDKPMMFDLSGALAADCMCRHCGYNLRGLHESGRCPECGTPVGASIRGDLLQFADPQWVEKVARGLTIIMWMILVGYVFGLLISFLGLVSPAAFAILGLATASLSYYGAWLMTTPDPSGVGEFGQWNARKIIRVTLIVGMLGQFCTSMAQSFPVALGLFGVFVAGAIVLALVGIAGEFAKFCYYEGLARRIPDESLADRALFLRWGYSLSMIGASVAGAIGLFATRGATIPPKGAALGTMACLGGVSGLALLIFSIMAVLLLIRLRRSVAEQARLARASWAAASV